MKYKVLIVEDDKVIRTRLEDLLTKFGYDVRNTKSFSNVLSDFVEYSPSIVLLDIALPFYDGYYWCDQIRKVSKVPIVFISSASENMNIVMAMNMGADDYITKPFEFTVLEAKIRAILRRSYDFLDETELLEHKGLILNIGEMKISFENTEEELTKNEYKILETLMREKKVVSRERIMEVIWQTDDFIDDNTLTVNIARLRGKLKSLGLDDYIKTKRGYGYYI